MNSESKEKIVSLVVKSVCQGWEGWGIRALPCTGFCFERLLEEKVRGDKGKELTMYFFMVERQLFFRA